MLDISHILKVKIKCVVFAATTQRDFEAPVNCFFVYVLYVCVLHVLKAHVDLSICVCVCVLATTNRRDLEAHIDSRHAKLKAGRSFASIFPTWT